MATPITAPSTSSHPSAVWVVVCLCAEWCGVCREYRAVFERVAGVHPAVSFRWCDVEDEPELAGDADIETFPTLRISQGGCVRFFGPVLPQPHHLTTLLRGLMASAS